MSDGGYVDISPFGSPNTTGIVKCMLDLDLWLRGCTVATMFIWPKQRWAQSKLINGCIRPEVIIWQEDDGGKER